MTDPKSAAPRIAIAAPLPDLDRHIAEWINTHAPQPGPDGTVAPEAAHSYRASVLRTLLLAAAGLAVQAKRLGLVFSERDFVEHARADYKYVQALASGVKPAGGGLAS